jgi:hypothetical protein
MTNTFHRDIYEWFDIGFHKFGRTPAWQQTDIAQVRGVSTYNVQYLQMDSIGNEALAVRESDHKGKSKTGQEKEGVNSKTWRR